MAAILTNNFGELMVDPLNYKGQFDKWFDGIRNDDGSANLATIAGVSPTAGRFGWFNLIVG